MDVRDGLRLHLRLVQNIKKRGGTEEGHGVCHDQVLFEVRHKQLAV